MVKYKKKKRFITVKIMQTYMKLNFAPLLFVILLITLLFMSGCVQQTATPSVIEQTTLSKVQYKDSLNFLLSLTDLPSKENWSLMERGERNVNDVASEAVEHNWSGGYYIQFKSSEKDEVTYLLQSLSIYPEERILGILNVDFLGNEPLSNPSIGEHSRAFKIRETSDFGKEYVVYGITFVKNNVLIDLRLMGTNTDYLQLKELALKAYDKIDGYGKPFDYQTLQPTSKTYTNSLYGFSMIQPNGWTVNTDASGIIRFDSPKKSGHFASINVNINNADIIFFDTEENREFVIDLLKKDARNFELLNKTSMTINGKKAYSFTYVATVSGENQAEQIVYIERNDKQVFLIRYRADSNQFETYIDVFTKTLNSFKQN